MTPTVVFACGLAGELVGAIAALAWRVGSTFGKIACKNSVAGVLVAIVCSLVEIALKTSARPVSANPMGAEFADATLLSGLVATEPNERSVI